VPGTIVEVVVGGGTVLVVADGAVACAVVGVVGTATGSVGSWPPPQAASRTSAARARRR
jgi:hypothetical protein